MEISLPPTAVRSACIKRSVEKRISQNSLDFLKYDLLSLIHTFMHLSLVSLTHNQCVSRALEALGARTEWELWKHGSCSPPHPSVWRRRIKLRAACHNITAGAL